MLCCITAFSKGVWPDDLDAERDRDGKTETDTDKENERESDKRGEIEREEREDEWEYHLGQWPSDDLVASRRTRRLAPFGRCAPSTFRLRTAIEIRTVQKSPHITNIGVSQIRITYKRITDMQVTYRASPTYEYISNGTF